MPNHKILEALKPIIARFNNQASRDEARVIMGDAASCVRDHFTTELSVAADSTLEATASAQPQAMHAITQRDFGFNVYEQPSYSSVDDFAWQSSQRYTTLEDVKLPENATFYNSKRKPLSKTEVETLMADGNHHLFDIALSNEYVLLGAQEKFSVADLEKRFSTNNEHLVPQSKSRTDGGTRVFKADPRIIVISDMKRNGDRSNLQVVFLDNHGNTKESISLIMDKDEEPVLVKKDCSATPQLSFTSARRYEIGPEDAPHYAYALALCHFAGGMTDNDAKNWFDREQAQEVASMLKKLSAKPLEQMKEPVLRDILSDAKVLDGRINPVPLLAEAFAGAMQTEIDQQEFLGRTQQFRAFQEARTFSHVDKLQQSPQIAGRGW